MPNVLVVDDEDEVRESIADYLEDNGCAVATAPNGAVALSRFSDDDLPDVVLLDLLMPEMGGRQLLENMRADPRLSAIPVVMLTSDPMGAPRGVRVEKKPMDLNRLLAIVRRLAASSS